jgi:choline dehydrogenase
VVDPKLKVYGVKNLRICDASIFPDCVSGHPVSSCCIVKLIGPASGSGGLR